MIATVIQMLKLPDGAMKVLVEGVQRAKIKSLRSEGPHFAATLELIKPQPIDPQRVRNIDARGKVFVRRIR